MGSWPGLLDPSSDLQDLAGVPGDLGLLNPFLKRGSNRANNKRFVCFYFWDSLLFWGLVLFLILQKLLI